MPFQDKRFDELPQGLQGREPDVQIFFHGQLILRSPNGQGCDIAVNPLATDHVLSVEVRIRSKGEGGAPDLIRMRHLGPLNFRDSEAMLIQVQGGPNPIGSAAFALVGKDPINFADRNSAPEEDFRWILNVEGPLFHNRALNPPGFATQNVIRLGRGEYYFKTAAHPNERLQYVQSRGGVEVATFDTIGSVGSADVYLEQFQSLVMKWQDDTQAGDRTLILNQSDETKYEIYIENTPLYLDRPLEADLPQLDEFVHYYKILDVPAAERFSVVPKMRPPDPDGGQFGTPEVPCQIIKQNGSGAGGGGG